MTTQTKWTADASNVSPGQIHLWVETETGEKASPENWDMDGPRYARLCEAAPELVESLAALFRECAMIHRFGGDASNAKAADEAQSKARALVARLGAV